MKTNWSVLQKVIRDTLLAPLRAAKAWSHVLEKLAHAQLIAHPKLVNYLDFGLGYHNWYRKWRGGTWYEVWHFPTANMYWTQGKLMASERVLQVVDYPERGGGTGV